MAKRGVVETGSQDCVNAPVSPNRPLWSLIAFAGATLSTRLWQVVDSNISPWTKLTCHGKSNL
jgi:hypothetical protein